MQKMTASVTWGLLFGLVVFFLISRGMATTPAKPAVAKEKQVTAKSKVKQTKAVAKKSTLSKKPKLKRSLPPFLVGLTIFMLAIFIGFELIAKVPPLLHSPLMSGANAISGVTIIGALVCARTGSFSIASILGLFAVICAMINVVGGFLVTDRMLQMYLKKK